MLLDRGLVPALLTAVIANLQCDQHQAAGAAADTEWRLTLLFSKLVLCNAAVLFCWLQLP
jgi:hypothetical protein